MASELPLDPDDFAAYYRRTPAALAIRECVRLRAVRGIDLPGPLLDVGCGDGLFARLAYPGASSWGIDIDPAEIERAQRAKAYTTLICGDVCRVDLPRSYFASAIANCSLEHVPDIDGALANIRRAMKPGGTFVMIVPTPGWERALATNEALDGLGLQALARLHGQLLNRVFAHIHLHDESTWTGLLARAGFAVERCESIARRDTSWAFDAFLYPSLVGFVTKKLTGRWVVAPPLRPLSAGLARGLINAIGGAVDATADRPAAEFLFVCTAVEPAP